MVRLVLTSIVAAALCGCAARNFKADNPVVGPPPPRIPNRTALADTDTAGEKTALGQSTVVQTGAVGPSANKQPLPMSAVAARVNGQPILVGAVLADKRKLLEANRSQFTAAQYRELQEKMLQERLPMHIEQAMMVAAVKAKLKPEQLKSVEEQLDQQFGEKVELMRKQMKVSSVAEVEAALQQSGLTLSMMRKMIGDKALAEQYMLTKLGDPPQITAPELRAAYHEREAEFTEREQVKWQQIQVSFKNYDKEEDAEAVAKDALKALKSGTSFDQVAREFSDGADAEHGGHWDWTQLDSLAAELQEPLRTLPPNKPSGVVRTPNNLQIVQVLERRDARVRPFEEVQDQIRQELRSQRQQDLAKEIIEELRATTVVETMFDAPTTADSASPAEERPSSKRFSANSRQGS